MHTFDRELSKYTFNGCDDCIDCCSGKDFILSPMILEDFTSVSSIFPILFLYFNNELKVVFLFSDGNNPCIYLKDNTCSIYSIRPHSCKSYPLTPLHNDILCDTECKGVFEKEVLPLGVPFLNKENKVHKDFYSKRFEDFDNKLFNTIKWIKSVEKNLIDTGISIRGHKFLQIDPLKCLDTYSNMHLNSLNNLKLFKGLVHNA